MPRQRHAPAVVERCVGTNGIMRFCPARRLQPAHRMKLRASVSSLSLILALGAGCEIDDGGSDLGRADEFPGASFESNLPVIRIVTDEPDVGYAAIRKRGKDTRTKVSIKFHAPTLSVPDGEATPTEVFRAEVRTRGQSSLKHPK